MRLNVLVFLSAMLLAVPGHALEIGEPMPLDAVNVMMDSTLGGQTAIAIERRRNGTLVIFSCNHCPWAKAYETRLARVGKLALEQGIGVIMINSNDPNVFAEDSFEVMQERARVLELEFPYVVDSTSEVARAFDARKTPEIFLFDVTGTLVYQGTVDDSPMEEADVQETYLADAVTAVGSGQPVSVSETKAIGCSIKFRN